MQIYRPELFIQDRKEEKKYTKMFFSVQIVVFVNTEEDFSWVFVRHAVEAERSIDFIFEARIRIDMM